MPIYAYKCGNCGSSQDVFKPLALLDVAEPCGACGTVMQRQICAPMVQMDYPGYNCPITGDWIEGRKAHEENLKKHGCRVYEPGELQDHEKAKAGEDLAFAASIDNTVEEFIEKLPIRKREQLAVELEHGADVAVTRN